MFEIFKVVLYLSSMGTGIIFLLLLIKPLTVRKFPAKWQYFIWLGVTINMLIPMWKVIPVRKAQILTTKFGVKQIEEKVVSKEQENNLPMIIEDTLIQYQEIPIANSRRIELYNLISYIWFGGTCVFLCLIFSNYFIFLIRKRKNSIDLKENKILEEVKQELHIKRKIRIRISKATTSPMLVGVFFPIIYIPSKNIDENAEKMVFLHELIHYKHRDLFYKWLTLFVNSIHWFNPFAYLLAANVSESCEVACDMAVIKELSDKQRQIYMNTILDLVEEEKRREF